MTIKPISKNNVILQKGDKCIFSTFTDDYPSLHLDQKITVNDVYDNGVVRVDNGTNILVNVLANQIDKI
jgi:predicted ribosome-associated RNA-binding protein Tma20